ncbi:MAG: aminopeptidase N [Planctomycetota bacterium]|jgi:aminopeptidase N
MRNAPLAAGCLLSAPYMFTRILSVAALLGLWACQGAGAADPRLPERTDAPPQVAPGQADLEHVDLQLVLNSRAPRFSGRARLRLVLEQVTERLRLDLAGPAVQAVRLASGEPLLFHQERGKLEVELGGGRAAGSVLVLDVLFAGTPGSGLRFGPSGVFVVQGVAEPQSWFPCLASRTDRATSSLSIDVPEDWEVLMAGSLLDESISGGRRVVRYRRKRAHLASELAFVAGPGVAAAALQPETELLAFLQGWTGVPAPWERARFAAVDGLPMAGGGGGLVTWPSQEGPADLALKVRVWTRRWIQDQLGFAAWSDVWWLEGLAALAESDWISAHASAAESDEFLLERRRKVRGATALRGADCEHPSDLYADGDLGQRAAMALAYLRADLGETVFNRGLARFFGEGRGRSCSSVDLRAALEQVAGRDLEGFFRDWVLAAGLPKLEVSWVHDPERARVLLRVHQVHELSEGIPDAYELRALVRLQLESGPVDQVVQLSKRRELIELPAASAPIWVRFDVGRRIPGELLEKRTPEQWLVVGAADPDGFGRLAAVETLTALVADPLWAEPVGQFLVERLGSDEWAPVRTEAARALGLNASAQAGRSALVMAVEGDASAQVRAAALAALTAWPADTQLFTTATQAFEASSTSDIKRAALALAVHADREGALALLTALQVPGDDVGEIGAMRLEALVRARAPGLATLLLRFASSQSADRSTRMVAIRSLGALIFVPEFGSQARRSLVELLRDTDPGLALLAAEVLGRAAARGDVGSQEELVQAFASLTDPRMQRVVRGVWNP